MELVDVPVPGEPGPGEVVLRPEVVGVCGSDVHLFHGDLGDDVFPRIQGHEISAVVDAVGPGADNVRVGDRVAVWPVLACGECYPCSIGRENVCANIAIIGAHVDGALQERLRVPASQVFAVGDMSPAVTAFVEPTSIGVRTVVRARVSRRGARGRPRRRADRAGGQPGRARPGRGGAHGRRRARAPGARARDGRRGGRVRRRGRGGRPGTRLGGRGRPGGAHRDDRRAGGGAQRVRRRRAGRPARAGGALAPRGQPPARWTSRSESSTSSA